jgi:hypothetical protein
MAVAIKEEKRERWWETVLSVTAIGRQVVGLQGMF